MHVVCARSLKQPAQPSHQLLDELLRRGEAEDVARRLGVVSQTVRNWCRPRGSESPTGTGRYNPLDALETLVECWSHDGTHERSHRLAQWLASVCGGWFVPLPESGDVDDQVLQMIGRALKQFSEFIDEVRRDWFTEGPRSLTRTELARIEREANDLVGAVYQLVCWGQQEVTRESEAGAIASGSSEHAWQDAGCQLVAGGPTS